MTSERQINGLPGLLAVKMIRSRLALPTDSHTSPPPSLISGGNDGLEPNTADKSGAPLMRGLNVNKNIPVSITKLMLGIRVDFISSRLIADKLFPVNPRAITGQPRMSLLLEAKSMPALIIKPRFILVSHTDDLGWYITSNQNSVRLKPQQDCQKAKSIQGSSHIAPPTVFQLT